MAHLEVKDLVKTLGAPSSATGSAVLRGVSFSIAAGECLGLKGSTGSGKSTLLRIIAGLMEPDGGEVWLDGRLLSSKTSMIEPAQRGVGMVFQHLGLWPHLSVEAHLDFALSGTTLPSSEQSQRRSQIMDTFLLRDLGSRYPAQLSGGERHLLAIARALCADIKLLLLDEPFTGLDSALKQRILETLKHERERRRLTTLLVTHGDDEMRYLCQRVEHLNEGHLLHLKMQNAE